jgi:SAM-dependent methyltransferase
VYSRAVKRSCPACDADRPKPLASIRADAVVRGNETYRAEALELLGVPADARFDLVRCSACDFVYAHELPDERLLTILYRDVIDTSACKGTADDQQWKAHQLDLASSLLLRATAAGTVRALDYGCGDGTVVHALNAAGISCLGFEPHLRGGTTGNITDSAETVRAGGPYQAILLSDVLEHLPDPAAVLADCRELLAPHGWICVSVPDFDDRRLAGIVAELRQGKPVTREVNPWEHLNYFSPATLAAMLRRAGYRVAAEPVKDFGYRSTASGARRIGNTIRAVGRLLAHAAGPMPGSTTLFAQKS